MDNIKSNADLVAVVQAYESDAMAYNSELSEKRTTLLNYYNQEKYGNEIEGESSIVTSEVQDIVENGTAALLRLFTQGKYICTVDSLDPKYDVENYSKQAYINWLFKDLDGESKLEIAIKDALLQYTGVLKVYWDNSVKKTRLSYVGLSEVELQKLYLDEELEEVSVKKRTKNGEVTFDAKFNRVDSTGRLAIENIAPEEFLIDKGARDFTNPIFCGQKTPKTRSELILMGFDKEIVMSLPKDSSLFGEFQQEKIARDEDHGYTTSNPSNNPSNDVVFLGEYYLYLDLDEDGVSELYQIFYAGNKILGIEQVTEHPYAVLIPIKIPHRAIGNCPADQMADLQRRNSVMMRQAYGNVYNCNYTRLAYNERVNEDDLSTVRAGGLVAIEGMEAIGDSISPISTTNSIVGEIMQLVEQTNVEGEKRTGFTRLNQGLDSNNLSQTATAHLSLVGQGQQRLDLIARTLAFGGLKTLFEKMIKVVGTHQDSDLEMFILGEALEIDPTSWSDNFRCSINIGLSPSDRIEKVTNLNFVLAQQKELLSTGSPLVDQTKLYATFERLCAEVGFKDAKTFFNDPNVPQEQLVNTNAQLQAQVQQLTLENQQLQEQLINPLIEIETLRANNSLVSEGLKIQGRLEEQKLENQARLQDQVIESQTRLAVEEIKKS